jgi:bifunctional non-homologous end joining protein LigD
VLVDVLHLDGHPTADRSYDERRELLESLDLTGDHSQPTTSAPGTEAEAVFASAAELGLAGVICKPHKSPYVPGAAGWIAVCAGTSHHTDDQHAAGGRR